MSRPTGAPRELVWLQFHFGPQLSAEMVRAFVLGLVADRRTGRLVFEVESDRAGVIWRISFGPVASVQITSIARTVCNPRPRNKTKVASPSE